MVYCTTYWKEYAKQNGQRNLSGGGISGRKTNHSLRATGVSDLFQAGVPEKMIQERSGHLSLDGLRQYQRTTLMQDEAVSRVLTSGSSFQQNVFQSQHIVPQTPSPTVQNFSSCNVTIYNAPVPTIPQQQPLVDVTNTVV